MSNLINISNLTKLYGKNTALDNLNLDIESGKVVGLLGPNGSGKTTLIKIIAGLMKSYSGKVLVDGKEPNEITKAYVSYLPDRNFLLNQPKVKDGISFFKDFFEDFDQEKCHRILNKLNINEESKISSLSKGMKEKLNLALILSRKAKVYILDEPIAGVDPIARDEILNVIIENIEPGSTMLICTHLVRDIENIFDDVAFISNGKIIKYDSTENIRIETGGSIDEAYREVFGGVYYA
ncbi:ABC transporter ATP-binding protein [Miniphocaeibacter massiliensis]|uniref:ABC transporter ATP-binding protein n=1 Tax=Miniphocaeibacter massiliensis TaxID=2041841 RepID=UPI000C1B81FF|nr:ABC transporter ATP-binding protein [Miniphocaeibacter massiliensis]